MYVDDIPQGLLWWWCLADVGGVGTGCPRHDGGGGTGVLWMGRRCVGVAAPLGPRSESGKTKEGVCAWRFCVVVVWVLPRTVHHTVGTGCPRYDGGGGTGVLWMGRGCVGVAAPLGPRSESGKTIRLGWVPDRGPVRRGRECAWRFCVVVVWVLPRLCPTVGTGRPRHDGGGGTGVLWMGRGCVGVAAPLGPRSESGKTIRLGCVPGGLAWS